MHNRIYRILVGLLVMLPLAARAQNSSLNTFSPFTYYGLGDILPVGTAGTRAMGSIGVAYWNRFEVNPVNPAAYGMALQQSGVLTVGLSGKSNYLETDQKKTANNGFSFNDFGFMLPVARNVGFAVTVNPFSSVGYKTRLVQEGDPGREIEVGHVLYDYEGEGNISRLKAGVGAQLFKGFLVGADVAAYVGTISRYTLQQITPVGSETFRNIYLANREEVAHISFDAGFQYHLWRTPGQMLTIGGVYQPNTSLRNRYSRNIYDPGSSDSISYREWRGNVTLPQRISGGVYYTTPKLGIGLDYHYQDWTGAFGVAEADRVTLRACHGVNVGLHYTPNRMDIRRALNRWTYRAGFRYSDLYLVRDGQTMTDMAVTAGLGIPLRAGSYSEMNIGVEFGRRGKTGMTPHGVPMVRENYFQVSVGFSLFDNQWFVKYKYD